MKHIAPPPPDAEPSTASPPIVEVALAAAGPRVPGSGHAAGQVGPPCAHGPSWANPRALVGRRSVLGFGLATAAAQLFSPRIVARGLFAPASSRHPAGVITPQAYGGKPDGGTDNYRPILDALAAAAAQKKPVFLSAGTWYVDPGPGGWLGVQVPTGVEVFGESRTICTWKSSYYEAYPYFGIATGSAAVSIHDLTFQDANGGNAILSQPNARNIHIYNLHMLGSGINSLYACVNSVVEDCVLDGSVQRTRLTAPLKAGRTYASLSVRAMPQALAKGAQLYLYRDPTYVDPAFQVVYTSAAVPAGATELPLQPERVAVDIPAGASARQIVISTGIAMTGAYERWNSTPGPDGNWVVGSTIRRCTVRNCDAANVFINMGYQSTIEDCYGSVAHDMNFDLEYCVRSSQRNNEGHFGGNRGCAVEMVNSECAVEGNTLYDTLWDGIRVTTDYVPPGNTRFLGGHTVAGNRVYRANRGIAFQGVASVTASGNEVRESLATGFHIYDVTGATLAKNTVTGNYGCGVEILNSTKVTMDPTNVITDNGLLGLSRPVAPQPRIGTGASTLASAEGYALQVCWTADVPVRGGLYTAIGSPSLPVYATPSAGGQTLEFDLSPPPGASGFALRVQPQSSYDAIYWSSKPATEWTRLALVLGANLLGSVDASGAVTYSGSATSGIAAARNSDGSWHVTVSAPAASDGSAIYHDLTCGAGVFLNASTGANGDINVQCPLRDNGYGGVYGWAYGVVVGGAPGAPVPISGHTALGVFAMDAAHVSNATISDVHLGAWGGTSAGGSRLSRVTFQNVQDCLHFSGAINGACFNWNVENCTFGTADASCGTGVSLNANRQIPGNAPAGSSPGAITACDFTHCKIPLDLGGGTTTVPALSGNSMPALTAGGAPRAEGPAAPRPKRPPAVRRRSASPGRP